MTYTHTATAIQSVAMFCYDCRLKFRNSTRAVANDSCGQPAMGTFQNMNFKTSRLTGWRSLYQFSSYIGPLPYLELSRLTFASATTTSATRTATASTDTAPTPTAPRQRQGRGHSHMTSNLCKGQTFWNYWLHRLSGISCLCLVHEAQQTQKGPKMSKFFWRRHMWMIPQHQHNNHRKAQRRRCYLGGCQGINDHFGLHDGEDFYLMCNHLPNLIK